MKLEIALLAGHDSKQFLAKLAKEIDRLEALLGGKTLAEAVSEEEEVEEQEMEDEEAETVAEEEVQEEESEEESEEEEQSEEAEEPEEKEEVDDDHEAKFLVKPKGKKVKGPTLDDVNDACKAKARSLGGKKGVDEVLKILQKKFKVKTVSDLKPEKYGDVIEAMAA